MTSPSDRPESAPSLIRSVVVTLAENDYNGMPCGRVNGVHFTDALNYDTPPVLELESPWWVDDVDEGTERDPNPACERDGTTLRIAGEAYPVRDFRAHVGNLCWNGYVMALGDAQRLARQLMARGFTIDAETLGQPFAETSNVR